MLLVVCCFKHLGSKLQEKEPVAVHVLPLGPDCCSPYYRPATASDFCGHLPQAVQLIFTHPLLYSAHLCCSADMRGHGKARRFAGQVLGFHGLPANYRFISSEGDPVTSLARSL